MTTPLRPRRRSATIAYVVGCFGLAVGAATTLARSLPMSWGPLRSDEWAMATAFTDLGVLAYALSLIGLGIGLLLRRGRPALIAGVSAVLLTGLHASWIVPWFVPDRVGPGPAPLTVLSLNLRHGGASPEQVWAQARDADVVVLLEYDDFDPASVPDGVWAKRFPASAGRLAYGWNSTVIYSRYPISDVAELPDSTIAKQWSAVVTTPQLGRVRVLAVHPCNPLCGDGRWASEHASVRAAVTPYLDEPLIVAGDFNAVDEHEPMRQLEADGLTSVTDIVGAGWLPTYPADRQAWLPPLLPIDHILLSRSLTATSVSTFRAEGTDHLGLVATIAGTG